MLLFPRDRGLIHREIPRLRPYYSIRARIHRQTCIHRTCGTSSYISTLAEKLSSAEEKGKKYDGLYESKKTAQEQIHALERTIKELEKDHATEKRELQSEAEQKLSAAQKDAALETLNAVAAKEREMNGQLLQLERENAKLQAKIELLEARLQQQP